MANITVLDQSTINKIAAGEVIERPASVVKELLENAIDANATAVTVEIRDGGCSMIRVTDNGWGIPKSDIPLAFLRHATSKIKAVEDLFTISSLGFRGEALASIAAESQVELITKTMDCLTGCRYQIEGGQEKGMEEIGAPDGTTIIARNLFYNTPARQKFLKTPTTEGAHVASLVEKIALSHPDISIRFIQNNQNKLYTSGNHNLKDLIYTVFGREIAANLLPVEERGEWLSVTGFTGKPVIARSNRNYENYFINGRYIKSSIISKAIEEAYKPYMMQHKYPFTMLHFTIDPGALDVNVHPTKMELRFSNGETVYQAVLRALGNALSHKELIPGVQFESSKAEKAHREDDSPRAFRRQEAYPEPFEVTRRRKLENLESGDLELHGKADMEPLEKREEHRQNVPSSVFVREEPAGWVKPPVSPRQLDLFEEKLLDPKSRLRHRLIGQLFDTYWLIEYNDKLFIIDQHAAHEKVLYEKTLKTLKDRKQEIQMVNPPIILTLNGNEEVLLKKYLAYFQKFGFEIEPFGGKEYAVRGVPANLLSVAKKELLMEMIDGLSEDASLHDPDAIYEKVASMSCKAAVKGGHAMSATEADQLIDQLLELDNPYACPHGRPTIISMTRYELEKKFKRIV